MPVKIAKQGWHDTGVCLKVCTSFCVGKDREGQRGQCTVRAVFQVEVMTRVWSTGLGVKMEWVDRPEKTFKYRQVMRVHKNQWTWKPTFCAAMDQSIFCGLGFAKNLFLYKIPGCMNDSRILPALWYDLEVILRDTEWTNQKDPITALVSEKYLLRNYFSPRFS